MRTFFKRKKILPLYSIIASVFHASPALSANFESPDSVENTIAQQKQQQLDWRQKLATDGFSFGADYFSLGVTSNRGANGDSVRAASGVARLLWFMEPT